MKKDGFKGLDVIATFINAMAFTIVIFTVYIPYWTHELTNNMTKGCIISIILLLLGTMLEVLGRINGLNYYKNHMYIAVNIWFYSVVASILCIYMELPYLWPYILYFALSLVVCTISFIRLRVDK